MKAMCEFFGVSRAAYYEWVRKLGQDDPDQERMEQVQGSGREEVRQAAAAWAVRLSDPNLTDETRAAFEAWRAASPENATLPSRIF